MTGKTLTDRLWMAPGTFNICQCVMNAYRWVFLNAAFHKFQNTKRHAAQEKPTRQRQVNHPAQERLEGIGTGGGFSDDHEEKHASHLESPSQIACGKYNEEHP